MRPRVERLLLIFSLALNVAFLTTAAVRQRHPATFRDADVTEPPRFSSHWHGHRAAALDRRLHLERQQRRVLRQHLNTLRPELEATRRELVTARQRFRESLSQDDAHVVVDQAGQG